MIAFNATYRERKTSCKKVYACCVILNFMLVSRYVIIFHLQRNKDANTSEERRPG